MFIQGLAPLCVVPELEKAILSNGGNINYKHFYQPAGTFECEVEGEKQEDCGELHSLRSYAAGLPAK